MFPATAAVMFTALALVWRTHDTLNAALKLAFILLAAWGGFEAMRSFGFVIATQP